MRRWLRLPRLHALPGPPARPYDRGVQPRPEGATAFVNAVVITGTGASPFDGSVVIEDDRIVDVLDGGARPRAARTVDCAGRTLLPGLIDAHVHIGSLDVDGREQQRRYFDSEAALRAGRNLTRLLDQGFTTARDAGGADAGFRRAVEQGIVDGPRLLVSGRPLSQTGGHGDARLPSEHGDVAACGAQIGLVSELADGPDRVLRAAREQLRRGADQIKVMAGGGVMSPTDRLEGTQFTLPELRAAVTAADTAGTYVLAHAYTPEAIRLAVTAGVRSIEHGNLLDEATGALLAEQGVFLVPTLVTYEKLYEEGEQHGLSRENLAKLAVVIDAGLTSLRIAHAAGVRIASGSDLLGPLAVHRGRELAIKAQVLGPMGAIVAATRTNAELLGLAEATGTLAPGKQADLLVVDGDPLADPGLLGRPETTPVVVTAGRPYRLNLN
jgi:imidazolonepropionase-like amidohydrolase